MTETEVLRRYLHHPRIVDENFKKRFSRDVVPANGLSAQLISVLLFIQTVEAFTNEVFYLPLLNTPSGKDPVIRAFMAVWSAEEDSHGKLLGLFLEGAGGNNAKLCLPGNPLKKAYLLKNRLTTPVANVLGKRFIPLHMVWGYVSELLTLQLYRLVIRTSDHPQLNRLITGIMQAEALHASFYRELAKSRLRESFAARLISRFFIDRFWSVLGSEFSLNMDIKDVLIALGEKDEIINMIEKKVDAPLQLLPGFRGCNAPSRAVGAFFS